MIDTPNHPATDALAYIAYIVKDKIDCATDAISGNIPQINTSAESLYNGNEWVLEYLNDLINEVLDAARPHVDGPTYSDGRPIWSTVEIEKNNSRSTHFWNPDPTKNSEHSFEVPSAGGRTIVTFTPPGTAESTFYPGLALAKDNV
ncbi:hypothetical protein [Rhodococcus erythropolis]|uniref:hypothetical protein n=1 Tax=Rhodococcus erythropolis TaxID=1833 RepID=UPI00087862AE|nr:hypothetical protein [Rhodococcus erythropolis]OFV77052.1 hypothetical protein RERY_22150 [Rhodococcus erythropolis]